MKNVENVIKKNVTKQTNKEIERLHKILQSEKYKDLSKVMKPLTLFFFDFITFFDQCRNLYKYKEVEGYYYLYLKDISHFISQYNGKGKNTKISRNINVLVTLGLIQKLIPFKNQAYIVKETLKIKQQIYRNKGKKTRTPNYFLVPRYYKRNILKEADKRAKTLIEHGYKLTDFSKSIVIKSFGQDFANDIFLDKREVPKKEEEQQQQVKQAIFTLLNNTGYTDKDQVIGYIKSNFKNKAYINRCIKSVIEELVKDNKIDYRAFSKQEKAYWNIPTEVKRRYIIKKGDRK